MRSILRSFTYLRAALRAGLSLMYSICHRDFILQHVIEIYHGCIPYSNTVQYVPHSDMHTEVRKSKRYIAQHTYSRHCTTVPYMTFDYRSTLDTI